MVLLLPREKAGADPLGRVPGQPGASGALDRGCGSPTSRLAGYQFVEQAAWYEAIDSSYHLGVDGISVPMVLLTTLLTPLAVLISWSIERERARLHGLFLLLETGMLGVFLSLDLLLFFVFWEIGLVPMYFLINQWGSANRNYASFKFLIYTMAGSLGLLLAIQMIGVASGTFDLVDDHRALV